MTYFARTHRTLLSLTLGLSLGLPLFIAQAQPIAAPTLNAAAIRAHAEFLANDLLEGRAAGSRGYELAAAYVAAQFRQDGLMPLGEGSYLQSVPLVEATVVLPGSTAILKRDNTTFNFEFSKDYLPSANFFNANTSLTAPLAFAGYGIDAPELKHNDFAELDLQGRVAVILSGAPERFNAQAQAYYGWRDTKYTALVKQGALGVIEIDPRESSSQWDRQVAMSWVSDMRLMNGDEVQERFPELKLRFRFKAEAAAQLFANAQSFEQAMQVARIGDAQGFALPGMLTLSATTGLRRIDSNNVVAVLRGADPQLQREYVLVTANLDHLGRGAAVNGDNIYNGMQHNAVGVAMLLDIARSMAAVQRPRRSLLFAAVTAGEKGSQGLQHLLTAEGIAPRSIVASVVLDTPLPLTRTSDVLAIGVDQSSLGSVLVNAASALDLRMTSGSQATYSLFSDSLAPLLRAHIPVLSMHSGLRARDARSDARSLQQDWFRLHSNQPSDDLQNAPMDNVAARELATLNANTVLQLANAAERPTWYRSSLAHRKLREN